MSVFNVDSVHISMAGQTAAQSAATINAEVAQMMAFLQGLSETWGGSAAISFQGLIEQWRATQAQVEESLSLISNQLQQASNTYAEAESAATALFIG